MDFSRWYTDTMDVYRITSEKVGSLTQNKREQVLAAVPCRIYQPDKRAIQLQQTAANIHQEDLLACGLDIDIRAGDELRIHRGALVGRAFAEVRAIAADPNHYPEPVGNAAGGLAHQEIRLLQQKRV